jgi:hypothetical protein
MAQAHRRGIPLTIEPVSNSNADHVCIAVVHISGGRDLERKRGRYDDRDGSQWHETEPAHSVLTREEP